MKKYLFSMLCCLCMLTCLSQQVLIKGNISDKITGEKIRSATVRIKNGNTVLSDSLGHFEIKANGPVMLTVTHASYEPIELNIAAGHEWVEINLVPNAVMLNAVVLSTKGIPTRILDAPFSAELIDYKQITQLPATSAYNGQAFKKGIDMTTSSLTFNTPSTRGFNGSGSTRVNQLIDGMDNQAPGLNFFVGNFAGPSDLDMESIELLPGASSALYGPGGMNGTILINSKNPFKYEGLSLQLKQGVMHVDGRHRDPSSYYDYSIRWAKAIGNKFAFKLGMQYLEAKDWLADDSANYLRSGTSGKLIPGTRSTDPNYDGVNVYGDETSVDLRQFIGAIALSYPPGSPQQNAILQLYNSMQNPTPVSRTGYAEKDVLDPSTRNLKLSGALHYKLPKNIEAILQANWATGNTVYTDDNRYALKGIKVGQYKFELKHKNWFVRSYTTQEDGGEAYSATVATQIFNEAWKKSYDPGNPMSSWYLQYAGAYIQAIGAGASNMVAHNAARAFADKGRPEAGSDEFNKLFTTIRKTPIPNGGLFKEKSQLWMTEGQYNFSSAIKFMELVAGGSIKKYILDSDGTLFIDTLKPISITEAGGYIQAAAGFFKNKLKLTASGRVDKNSNFKWQFTPRASALIKVAKDHNLRLSYQTAYRFPGNLSQWIRLNVGGNYMLLGGLPWVMDYMNATKNEVYQVNSNGTPMSTPYVYKALAPETMRSFEFGYKAFIQNKLLVDIYGYLGKYEDFIGRIGLYQPATGKAFSIVVNSNNKVKTHGFGAGFDYRIQKNWSAFANFYSDVITDVPTGFKSYFNTPKYRLNGGIANSGLGKKENISFNVMVRWQDSFNWEGELANGPINAFATTDAQVSYKFSNKKTMVRLGGTNIFNRYYKNAYANPMIGGVYYVGFLYNL